MNLSETIHIARNQSVEALEARQAFISTYWAYRSYKASRLPSFYMYGNMMNFDRSLTLLQNPDDGTLNYVSSNNLQNSVGLQVNQNITFTGGTLSVATDLSRIDQFGMNKSLTWYSRPVTVSYYQPLFTYNQFKWDKKIEPKEYEKGKREYLERMEDITIDAVYAYHNLLLAKTNNAISKSNFENSGNMLRIAGERLQLGDVTKAEYLQLELRMLNDSISINETAVAVRQAQMQLNSLLGYDESYEIIPDAEDTDAPKRVTDPEALGLRHLAFRVEDVAAAAQWLNSLGIETEPIRSDPYNGGRMTFFRDPDGLPLELHE